MGSPIIAWEPLDDAPAALHEGWILAIHLMKDTWPGGAAVERELKAEDRPSSDSRRGSILAVEKIFHDTPCPESGVEPT